MKSTFNQRHSKAKMKIKTKKQKRLKKINEHLTHIWDNKEHLLPKNNISTILKFLNLPSLNTTSIGQKFKKDLALVEVLDKSGELTKFGKKIICLSEEEKIKALKKKAADLPKIKKLKIKAQAFPKTTTQTLVDMMPPDFFSDGANTTKKYLANNALTWLE